MLLLRNLEHRKRANGCAVGEVLQCMWRLNGFHTKPCHCVIAQPHGAITARCVGNVLHRVTTHVRGAGNFWSLERIPHERFRPALQIARATGEHLCGHQRVSIVSLGSFHMTLFPFLRNKYYGISKYA